MIIVKGIVIASEWEQSGEVSAVDIAGYDEKRYRVADENMGPQLRTLVKKKIIAQGIVAAGSQQELFYVHHFWLDDEEPASAAVE